MRSAKTTRIYETSDVIRMPEPIEELGIEAGRVGVVDCVYDEGRMLLVEVPRPDGTTIGFVDIRTEPEPHVVGYSAM